MYDLRKETNEAIYAGERALQSLRTAKQKLDNARGWGILDLFGGGGLSGLLKHMKVSEASNCLNQANQDLKVFQRELRDVTLPSKIQVEIDGFLTFADFFFDGFLADFLVQRKINQAREQVDEAIWKTEKILNDLYRFR